MTIISSKDIILISIGLVISFIFAFIFSIKQFDLNNITSVYLILIIALLLIGITVWALHKRIDEIKDELDNQATEQKRLGEKLKIHEQLIDMKAEIKELQKKVFKK
ncbi:hypothetical protein A3K73_00625 [Candidatus Pacearchaeota archaeon RBG_13_36_9]|nr:MAG: hypothetical protein A3K73_00625 [Candidatus Pacearchaeota archaeon RBG_13_36_9]